MPTPPTRPGSRERYDAKLQEVVDVAARVFAEQGYHGTSIEDLLAATGLTRGGLYHYIEGKADLLIAVQRELLAPLLEAARAAVAATDDPVAQLREVTRLWVVHVGDHRDHMAVFAAERRTVASDPRWAEVVEDRREFEALLEDVFARGEASGAFRIADRGVALRAFLGMVNHLPWWFDPAGRVPAETVAERFCDLVLDGLAPR